MLIKEAYDIMDIGMDNNVLCFDGLAPAGILTKHLVFSMLQHVPQMTHMLIGPTVFPEFLPNDWKFGASFELYGVTIKFDNRLHEGYYNRYKDKQEIEVGLFAQYYKDRDGSLASGDTNLILGYNSDKSIAKDTVILGSC